MSGSTTLHDMNFQMMMISLNSSCRYKTISVSRVLGNTKDTIVTVVLVSSLIRISWKVLDSALVSNTKLELAKKIAGNCLSQLSVRFIAFYLLQFSSQEFNLIEI